jgi:hypothetical protein
MSDIASGFPKNLAYNLKKLDAGFSKTKVKIIPDNQTVAPNGIVRFRITGNGLYDLRSLCMYMTGACSTDTNNRGVHFPRYSASLIENISITANNTTLCSINGYNMLYNKLMDVEGADISQYSKRMASGERYDPSIRTTIGTGATDALTVVSNVLGATDSDSGEKLVVNNWLGILGSCSTPVIDLADWGDLYINIQFAPTSVLWQSIDDADDEITSLVALKYTLSDVYMTIDRCSFQDPLYYNLKTEKLLSPEGLNVAYYDYFTAYGSSTERSSISMNFNVNSASLDQVIVMLRPELYNDSVCRPLVLFGSTNAEATKRIFTEVIANPALYDGQGTTSLGTVPSGFTNLGDAYNQVYYFISNADNLQGSKFSINSVDIDPYSVPPIEVFNKVLQYTGFQNIDLGTSGLHAGIMSVHHFLKYYFVDICDLTNISGDNQFWISGIDGRGGGINVQYNATFRGTNSGVKVLPLAYCRSTKVLRINAGRQLTLDPPSM